MSLDILKLEFRWGGREKDCTSRCLMSDRTTQFTQESCIWQGEDSKRQLRASWALSRRVMMSLARQTDKEEQAQTGSRWVHCGYFEFGTFMSPRFLILVLRNLKTKLLGFGIESSIFPQTQAHWSCDGQSCGCCRVLQGDGTWDSSMSSLFWDWHSFKVTKMIWRMALS